jgi:acyl-[acyl-carrier-protein]-phospholipid O-acyltransferase / long-chain-fatty-acid--[acyl-carrier-protein] ligase
VSGTQFHLLGVRRFLPLFVVQALGAFNDNAFKNALVILIVFDLALKQGFNGQIFVTLAAGLFVLPYFLFSSIAGQLADKYDKAKLVRIIKFVEIVLMALAGIGFQLANVYWMLTILFLMGAQSTFFGPIKYGILPQHLREDELIGGNALIEAGTFLSILLGTLFGGLLIRTGPGPVIVTAALIAVAVGGYLASRFVPVAAPVDPGIRVNPNLFAETAKIISFAAKRRGVFLPILGISWFWLMGAIFLAQFPSFAKDTLQADEQVSNLFIMTFSVGIALGSLWCNKLLKGRVAATYVPLGAIGITLFCIDLFVASPTGGVPVSGTLMGVGAFLSVPNNWRVLADLTFTAVCGGLYIVPLYTLIQAHSEAGHTSRNIAANNVLNAVFMVAGTVATLGMLELRFTIPQIFLTIAIANAFVAAYMCKLLPDEVAKAIGRFFLKLFYRVEVKGWENYDKAGERAVIIANHTSFLDAALLGAFLPRTPTFAINTFIAKKWWVKPAFALFDLLPVDPSNPMAVKKMVRAVEAGRHCVIFPEGRLTVTGALMKVYEGPGTIAHLAGASILPVRIDGAQYTSFSRLRGKVRLRRFPKITIILLPPRKFDIPADTRGRKRRQLIGARLYDVMTEMVFETSPVDKTLFEGVLDAKKIHGGKSVILEDPERNPVSYNRLITGSFVLGKALSRLTKPKETVGVLLPNSVAAVVTFFALQAHGRVPAMLNFSTGVRNMRAACETALVETVLTSRRFVEFGRLEDVVAGLGEVCKIVYLEDLRGQLGLGAKLGGLFAAKFAKLAYRRRAADRNPDTPAVVLFTSGSEGMPKGVVLSHRNIQANRYQLSARVDFNPTDIVFNALPIFHSFGLTGGLVLPLLSGVKCFLYPSPLHYRIVPELVYDTNATIMFGTDTFLSGYARSAHPYDFYSLRYVFAGAEKLKPETRAVWSEKFGVRIFEGYGATETSPVLATNTPMQSRTGTVGRFLPGIRYRLTPVPGIETGGRLEVSGPNVMLGYLLPDRPGVLVPPPDGWYDTGDIVAIDEDGYVAIVGRAKRFAKIAGEMVSLTAVEAHAAATWPDHAHAVISAPDARKGEQLILVTEHSGANRQELQERGRADGLSELMVPREIVVVDKLPILGTGKVDYVSLQKSVTDKFG